MRNIINEGVVVNMQEIFPWKCYSAALHFYYRPTCRKKFNILSAEYEYHHPEFICMASKRYLHNFSPELNVRCRIIPYVAAYGATSSAIGT